MRRFFHLMICGVYLYPESYPRKIEPMKFFTAIILIFCCQFIHPFGTYAQVRQPDTVKIIPDTVTVGIYITSIHDVDFKEKEYSVNLWLWLKYRNRAFKFDENMEVP